MFEGKYNPIERCWGVLELHWNGALLDSIEAVLGYAETMSWKGGHPEVVLVEQSYSKAVRLGREEMEALESQVVRLPSLGKWFVSIPGRQVRSRTKQSSALARSRTWSSTFGGSGPTVTKSASTTCGSPPNTPWKRLYANEFTRLERLKAL